MPAPRQTAEHARQVLAEKLETKNKLYETCTVDEYSLGADDLRRLREGCAGLGGVRMFQLHYGASLRSQSRNMFIAVVSGLKQCRI